MSKLIYILLFCFLVLISIFPFKPAYAAECTSIVYMNVTPTSGDTNTQFSFTGTIENCPNKTYPNLSLKAKDGSTQIEKTFPLNTDAEGKFNVSYALPKSMGWTIYIQTGDPAKVDPVPIITPDPPITIDVSPLTPPPAVPPGTKTGTGTGTTGTRGAGQPCKNGDPGIETAIGCVPTEPTQFILAVSKLATGMGGGIALLLMIAGAFKMITSAGNPDSVKAGSEQITSAIIGLLFIIFAVLLLKVIGVDILDLPGFGPP